jgi:hypothetical protein
MVETLELVEEFFDTSVSTTGITINGSGLATPALELDRNPTPEGRCLWCDRHFTPRATGGSVQKFCCTGHRQQFWIAARRWTTRAIEVGLLSVDCLKASHTSVHAVRGALSVVTHTPRS